MPRRPVDSVANAFAWTVALATFSTTTRAGVEWVRAVYSDDLVRFDVEFAADASVGTGWEFQIFIDADGDRQTGYGRGFDMLVRGVDFDTAHPLDLRDTQCADGDSCDSGGWGRRLGLAAFRQIGEHHVQFDVPLGSPGPMDGDFRYDLETYDDGSLRDWIKDLRTSGEPGLPTRPVGDSSGIRKNRSLSLHVPATATAGPGAITALRVALVDLQNPQPPNLDCCPPPDFSSYESGATCTDPGGCIRWVGKPGTFLESQDNPGGVSYRAARLQCTPLYRDWAADDEFHVNGAEIVPSSTYHVENFAQSCQGNEATCAATSGPLVVTTTRWGDIAAAFNPPAITTQPDAIDVTQLVDKFKSVGGAPRKAIAQIQPNLPEPNADINALDVVAVVGAVKQFAYPFSGPCPCPSPVACNAQSCVSSANCSGGLCVKTCAGGPNVGAPCINNTHCPGVGGLCGSGFCRDRCGRCTP